MSKAPRDRDWLPPRIAARSPRSPRTDYPIINQLNLSLSPFFSRCVRYRDHPPLFSYNNNNNNDPAQDSFFGLVDFVAQLMTTISPDRPRHVHLARTLILFNQFIFQLYCYLTRYSNSFSRSSSETHPQSRLFSIITKYIPNNIRSTIFFSLSLDYNRFFPTRPRVNCRIVARYHSMKLAFFTTRAHSIFQFRLAVTSSLRTLVVFLFVAGSHKPIYTIVRLNYWPCILLALGIRVRVSEHRATHAGRLPRRTSTLSSPAPISQFAYRLTD